MDKKIGNLKELNDYAIVFYLKSGNYLCIFSDTEEVKEIDAKEFYAISRKFDMLKYSGHTQSEMKTYLRNFKQCVDELLNNDIFVINWTKSYNNFIAISNVFKNLTYKEHRVRGKQYKNFFSSGHHEQITRTEYLFMQRTYNGGLIYVEPSKCQSYGYDYSAFYLNICCFSEFQIPTKEGKRKTFYDISELPKIDEIQYGIYKIRITSKHKDACKIFSFSKNEYYTHYSLKFALQKKEQFNFEFEMIDGCIEALIYDNDCLIYAKDQFRQYGKVVLELKKQFPKNQLVKMLVSSFAGHLQHKNVKRLTYDEINAQKIKLGEDYDVVGTKFRMLPNGEEEERYILADIKKPYTFNIRLLPYLTAYGRNKIARLALKDIDNVIRIHTDNVCFKTEQIFETNAIGADNFYVKTVRGPKGLGKHNMLNPETLKPEAKTTGFIKFNKKDYINYTEIYNKSIDMFNKSMESINRIKQIMKS